MKIFYIRRTKRDEGNRTIRPKITGFDLVVECVVLRGIVL